MALTTPSHPAWAGRGFRAWAHKHLWLRVRRIDPTWRIFISHRRVPSDKDPRRRVPSPFAHEVYDVLARAFGPAHVFFDAHAMHSGSSLPAQVRMAVERARIVVVLIEPGWEGEQPDGTRRIDLPGDWVRLEVARAAEVQCYPVLSTVLADRPPFPVIIPLLHQRDPPTLLPIDRDLEILDQQNTVYCGTDVDWRVDLLSSAAQAVEAAQTVRWDWVVTALVTTASVFCVLGVVSVAT